MKRTHMQEQING